VIDLWNTLPVNPSRKYTTRRYKDIEYIVVHCIDAEDWTAQKLNNFCTGIDCTPDDFSDDLKYPRHEPTCSYHDYFRQDGTWYHMVDYHVKTWHVGRWNRKCIGVALEYIPRPNHYPSDPMMQTLVEYLAIAIFCLSISPQKIIGHREVPGTPKECPGKLINLDDLRESVNEYVRENRDRVLASNPQPFRRMT